MSRIVFNDREYSSPDEMPPDTRRQYDEVMASVVASEKESGPGQPSIKIRTRLVINGKEYSSVAEMPPAIRAAYEKFVNRNDLAVPNQNTAAMSSSRVLREPGTSSSSLDLQLRLPASTKTLLTLLVVAALAALVWWR
jgi:hypothetical protein